MNNDKQSRPQQGVEEIPQDRKQEEAARQRPGQTDEKIRDAESRRPKRKDDNPG